MTEVRAKKFLGQHFLTDEKIAERIVESLSPETNHVLEIGPGMGVLTKYLIKKEELDFHVVEIDRESVAYLHDHYPTLDVIEGDFLQYNLTSLFQDTFSIIGNFPYNISSQILFKVFDNRDKVTEVVGMFQKEVAERVAAGPGSKTYGILSVLLSAFYNIEYLFTVHENCRKFCSTNIVSTDSLFDSRTVPGTCNSSGEFAVFEALSYVSILTCRACVTLIALTNLFSNMAHSLYCCKTFIRIESSCLLTVFILDSTACCKEEACILPRVAHREEESLACCV